MITDYSSLRLLSNLKDPTGNLERWAMELLGNQVTIKQRKSAFHHVSDALSRMYASDTEAVSSIDETHDPWYLRRVKNIREIPMQFPAWKIEEEKLYFHRPNTFVDPLLPDIDAWKVVLPTGLRNLPKTQD